MKQWPPLQLGKLSIHGDAASMSIEMAERLIADAENAVMKAPPRFRSGTGLSGYAGSRSTTRMIAATVPLLVASSWVPFPQLYTSPALHVNFMLP